MSDLLRWTKVTFLRHDKSCKNVQFKVINILIDEGTLMFMRDWLMIFIDVGMIFIDVGVNSGASADKSYPMALPKKESTL